MADFDKLERLVGEVYQLRKPCQQCGETRGRIYPKGNQDCVFCLNCSKFQYNAPRTETGREVRTLQTIRHISPSQRSRLLERAHGRCELCASIQELTIAHIVSVKDGFDFLTDAQLNSDENLMVLCAECNAGQGQRTMPAWLAAAIIYRRSTR